MQALNFKNIQPLVKASKYLELRAQISSDLIQVYGINKPETHLYLLNKFTELISNYQETNTFPKIIKFLNYQFETIPLEFDDYSLGKKQYDQITQQLFEYIGVPVSKKLFISLSSSVSVTYLKGEKLTYENLAKNFKAYRHASVDHYKTYTQLEYAAKVEQSA